MWVQWSSISQKVKEVEGEEGGMHSQGLEVKPAAWMEEVAEEMWGTVGLLVIVCLWCHQYKHYLWRRVIGNETVEILELGVGEVVGINSRKPWFWEQKCDTREIIVATHIELKQLMLTEFIGGRSVQENENLRRLDLSQYGQKTKKGLYDEVCPVHRW